MKIEDQIRVGQFLNRSLSGCPLSGRNSRRVWQLLKQPGCPLSGESTFALIHLGVHLFYLFEVCVFSMPNKAPGQPRRPLLIRPGLEQYQADFLIQKVTLVESFGITTAIRPYHRLFAGQLSEHPVEFIHPVPMLEHGIDQVMKRSLVCKRFIYAFLLHCLSPEKNYPAFGGPYGDLRFANGRNLRDPFECGAASCASMTSRTCTRQEAGTLTGIKTVIAGPLVR